MKIFDPVTGETFEDAERARRFFCNNTAPACREGCPLYTGIETCRDFVARDHDLAVRLMGYKLEDDKK